MSIKPYLNYNERVIALAQYLGINLDIDEDDDEAILNLTDELDSIRKIYDYEYQYHNDLYTIVTEDEDENDPTDILGKEEVNDTLYLIY